MKPVHSFYFSMLFLLFACSTSGQTTDGITVKGGKLLDVVVRRTGFSDSTFTVDTELVPLGPSALDIDKNGNVYVLDFLSYRVLKFDKDGRWIATFNIDKKNDDSLSREPWDVAVDNRSNIFICRAMRILKFSPEGKFLLQTDDVPGAKEHRPAFYVSFRISIDKSGRIYNNQGSKEIGIYDSQLKLIKRMENDSSYADLDLTQKELGDDIFFRRKKYLLKTTLEESTLKGKIDTVAILPEELIEPSYRDVVPKDYREQLNFSYKMLGFDKDSCFYFFDFKECSPYSPGYGSAEGAKYEEECKGMCERCIFLKYHLSKGRLVKIGELIMGFVNGGAECSNRAIAGSVVLAGDGTIYWLHGTVDTVKISKIIFDK